MVLPEWNAVADLGAADLAAIEKRTQELGKYLFGHALDQSPSFLNRRWWDDRLMQWAMDDESLKIELFRFVDVLPMLHSSSAVVEHLQEYLHKVRGTMPTAIRAMLGVGRRTSLTRGAIARIARLSAMDLARRFIAGTNTAEVVASALRERQLGRAFTLDILGEAVITDQEAQRFFAAYVELIEGVSPPVNAWQEDPTLDRANDGLLPRMNLSIKLSALDCRFDGIDPAGALRRAGGRFRELLRVARRNNAFINVDMESYEKKDLTLYIFRTVLSEPEFRDVTNVGIVIQCYLHDAAEDLQALVAWAKERGAPVWVRLVKGAYWDYETIHARAEGWPIPVYQKKWQSDANFERATRFVLQNHQHLRPALGTHNLRSIAQGLAAAEQMGVASDAYELQMLYGMADSEKRALTDLGRRLRIYMPYGELIPGMAYLVRRLLENTSNDSFLRAGFIEGAATERLLRNPVDMGAEIIAQPVEDDMSATSVSRVPLRFKNHPPIDFSREENCHAMRDALELVLSQFGDHYPLVIGGERIDTEPKLISLDPSFYDRVVGTTAIADRGHVDHAVAAAKQALPAWFALGAVQRAELLRRTAQLMRDRFFELSAWAVYESGKGWREATGDVCEAIDFCEYYAAGAESMEVVDGADVPGEQNRFEYSPRGVTAVIAPWNFPLAILTGMTTAALATGNTVVMKPAEQTSVIAARLMLLFEEAGIPPGVVNYLPGEGAKAGAALVDHPDVAMIVFTGSRDVGLAINRRAAEVSSSGIRYVKKVIAEMGGKNAIIVDADADLDEAVMGVVKSAFGFQGQKCSACSRVLVLDAVYEQFVERLVAASASLEIGPAENPATVVGPVIDKDALDKTWSYIEIGRTEGRAVLQTDIGDLAEQGYFVGPHIFADVSPTARLAREEVFGPVLAVLRVKDLSEAIALVNDSDYALTAGGYSRSPANLDRMRRELMVGNLYLNRSITGACVGRHPFGGFKLSGIGSKAGGPDYLLQFVIPRTITENTMRRGFAPDA